MSTESKPVGRSNRKPDKAYVLADPRDGQVRYVGVTWNPEKRLKGHLTNAHSGRITKCKGWLRGLIDGGFKPVMHVIEEGITDWDDAERFWIAYFRSIGADLTNGTDGGHVLPPVKGVMPWSASSRGVKCPTGIFAQRSAAMGVSAESRRAFKARIGRMPVRERCEAECYYADLMLRSNISVRMIKRWMADAIPKMNVVFGNG